MDVKSSVQPAVDLLIKSKLTSAAFSAKTLEIIIKTANRINNIRTLTRQRQRSRRM